MGVQQVAHKNTNEHIRMGIIIYALCSTFSLRVRSTTASFILFLFLFYSYSFMFSLRSVLCSQLLVLSSQFSVPSSLFADAYTTCLRFLCATHPSTRTETESICRGEPEGG